MCRGAFYRSLFVFAAALLLVEAKQLPSYITPCKKDDPNLSLCAKQNAARALPSILKGDRAYNYPSLTPLHLPLIQINPTNTLSVTLKDVILNGLETVVVEKTDINLKNQHVTVVVSFSRLNIQCHYDIEGQILILPIRGSGPGNLTFENVKVNYAFNYILVKKDDGKEYIDDKLDPVVSYTVGKSYYQFDNLFGGDNTLGDKMNEFLNEHADEVNKDLGESISHTINAITTSIIKGIATIVPYDEIFI